MRYRANRYSISILSIFVILTGVSASVIAQTSDLKILDGSSAYKNNKVIKSSEDFNATVGIDLKTINYTESSSVDNNFQQQVQLEFNLKKQGWFFSETSLIVGTFTESNSFYYALPEAYIGFGHRDRNMTMGRKIENLSFVDSFFHFGLVQSNFTNDNINFIEGGLTGISAHYSDNLMGVIANFMPIFMPNQIPQIKADDGRIVSSNRWAPSPPAKFKFGDEYKDINYAIRDYNITDIISNSGYMLHAYVGENKKRPTLSATYAKKPINEVALSRDTYSDISNFEGYVYLTPVVLTHEVRAIDLNLDYENFKSTFSYLADDPINQRAENLEVMQQLSPLNILSFYAALDLTENFGKKIEVYTAAATISGGEIRDINSENKESTFAVANSRTLFKKPLRLGLKGEMFFIYNRPFESDINMTYDQQLKGSLLSLQFKYSPIKKMKVSVGADIIGVESELSESVQGNFLDQNKANDRFFAGINYVF